jgi:vacuolar-type H+-ATPase subunit E/Vma4
MSGNTTKIEVDLIQSIVDKRNRMLSASKEQAEQVTQASKKECGKIKAEAERQVKTIIDSRLKGVRERIVGEAEMQARHKLLATRDNLISSIFEDAILELSNLASSNEREEEYLDILTKLIGDGIDEIGGESFIILANSRDITRIKNQLIKIEKELKLKSGIKLGVSNEPLNVVGGIILENGDRTMMFYNTFESRMAKVRHGIRTKVGELLEVV